MSEGPPTNAMRSAEAVLGVAEALARLAAPGATERWSPLGEARWFVVDARGGMPPARAWATVRTLPCPTIALVAAEATGDEGCDPFDVVVTDDATLDALATGIGRAPIAAATLAQTLRANERLPIADALVVESLAYATLQAGPEHEAWLAGRAFTAARPGVQGPAVAVSEEGATLVLTLARPERHNAYSTRMRDDLVAALDVALADVERAVVLRGEGPSFCSGGDLEEFGTRPDPATAHVVRTTRSAGRVLAALAPRVRAEVHGACIGAGVELAAFAGTVVAAPDAFFRLPEIAMGLVPGAGGTVSLPRRIGRRRTAELALSGRRIDAETAHAWGLVDAIAMPPRRR